MKELSFPSKYTESENVLHVVQDGATAQSGSEAKRNMSLPRAVQVQSAIVVPCYNESARLRVDESESFLDSGQRSSGPLTTWSGFVGNILIRRERSNRSRGRDLPQSISSLAKFSF